MARTQERPVAVITGASAGIGQGFARRLAREGHDLVLVARRRDLLEALAAALGTEHEVRTEVLPADLTEETGIQSVIDRVGRADVELLVNNAGFGTVGAFAELPLERELSEIDLNVRALVRLTHAALAGMALRGRGAIINVASMAAFQAIPYNATYAATKAFVLHFSEAVHEEAKECGVTVTALCPGPVKTEFQEVAGIDESIVPSFGWESVESVVDSALAGLRSRRAIAIPGAFNAVTANASRLTPRFVTRRISGSIFRRVRG